MISHIQRLQSLRCNDEVDDTGSCEDAMQMLRMLESRKFINVDVSQETVTMHDLVFEFVGKKINEYDGGDSLMFLLFLPFFPAHVYEAALCKVALGR